MTEKYLGGFQACSAHVEAQLDEPMCMEQLNGEHQQDGTSIQSGLCTEMCSSGLSIVESQNMPNWKGLTRVIKSNSSHRIPQNSNSIS